MRPVGSCFECNGWGMYPDIPSVIAGMPVGARMIMCGPCRGTGDMDSEGYLESPLEGMNDFSRREYLRRKVPMIRMRKPNGDDAFFLNHEWHWSLIQMALQFAPGSKIYHKCWKGKKTGRKHYGAWNADMLIGSDGFASANSDSASTKKSRISKKTAKASQRSEVETGRRDVVHSK